MDVLFPFLQKVGIIALDSQLSVNSKEKYDGSVVTDADIKISDEFNNLIQNTYNGSIVLDEEKVFNDLSIIEKIKNTEYVWVIDPIDGTKTYFNGSSLFSISIGLYRYSKPIFGLIYVPTIRKMIYNDLDNVYEISNVFTDKQSRKLLKFVKQKLDGNSIVCFPVKEAGSIKNYNCFSFIDSYSTYLYSYQVMTNIAVGAFLKKNVSMWDIYGALPIAKQLGLKFYNVDKDKLNVDELSELDFSLFTDKFKVKNMWLLCHPDYKDELTKIFN